MLRTIYLTCSLFILAGCNTNNTASQSVQTGSHSEQNLESLESDSMIAAEDEPEFIFSEAGLSNIEMTAFIYDPDENNPTNVRGSANGKIIEKLPPYEEYMIRIISQKDGWFEFENLTVFSEETENLDGLSGWIHHSVLAASTRNCYPDETIVYKYPEEKKEYEATVIEPERLIRFDQLYNEFVHITSVNENKDTITGWIKTECVCGNPVTTCP